jgi:hypothetical protein
MTLPLLATKLLAGGMLALGIGAGTLGAVSSANRTAIDTAITNKDLTAYKSATIQAATDAANSITQDQLNTISDRFAQEKIEQEAINTAIKNNDFAAFKSARLADKDTDNNKGNRPVPTDTQLQTRFDALVAQYKLDGTLPQAHGFGMGGMRGGPGGHRGGMKGFDAPDGVTDSSSTSSSSATAQ